MVGTRQQQTLGDKGSDESEAEDHLLHLPTFGKTNLGNRQLILVKHQWLFCKSSLMRYDISLLKQIFSYSKVSIKNVAGS